MRRLIVLLSLSMAASVAQAAPPSDASLDELFALIDLPASIEAMKAGLVQGVRQSQNSMWSNKPLNEKQQKIIDDLPRQYQAILDRQYNWPKLHPIYLHAYRDTFTQEEVDGMIAFYQTPAGRALHEKMPLVTQRTNLEMQSESQLTLMRTQEMTANAMKRVIEAR